jgi:hypothetical protein
MDPYLETSSNWKLFRPHFFAALQQVLSPSVTPQYKIILATRRFATEFVLFTTIEREEHTEEYLEIRKRDDHKLITIIDLTSVESRTLPIAREAHRETRKTAITERSAYVEIDLLTLGQPVLEYERSGLPPHDYTVTVTRSGSPERFEIYTASVRRRLPKFKLPLAQDDRDVVVDLQQAFSVAYDVGNFASVISYQQPLPAEVRLSQDDRDWVQDFFPQP